MSRTPCIKIPHTVRARIHVWKAFSTSLHVCVKLIARFCRGKSFQTEEGWHGHSRGLYGVVRGVLWNAWASPSTFFTRSSHLLILPYFSTLYSFRVHYTPTVIVIKLPYFLLNENNMSSRLNPPYPWGVLWYIRTYILTYSNNSWVMLATYFLTSKGIRISGYLTQACGAERRFNRCVCCICFACSSRITRQ